MFLHRQISFVNATMSSQDDKLIRYALLSAVARQPRIPGRGGGGHS